MGSSTTRRSWLVCTSLAGVAGADRGSRRPARYGRGAMRNAIAGLPESSWGGTSVLVYAVTYDAMDLPALPAKAGWPDRWTFNQPGPGPGLEVVSVDAAIGTALLPAVSNIAKERESGGCGWPQPTTTPDSSCPRCCMSHAKMCAATVVRRNVSRSPSPSMCQAFVGSLTSSPGHPERAAAGRVDGGLRHGTPCRTWPASPTAAHHRGAADDPRIRGARHHTRSQQ